MPNLDPQKLAREDVMLLLDDTDKLAIGRLIELNAEVVSTSQAAKAAEDAVRAAKRDDSAAKARAYKNQENVPEPTAPAAEKAAKETREHADLVRDARNMLADELLTRLEGNRQGMVPVARETTEKALATMAKAVAKAQRTIEAELVRSYLSVWVEHGDLTKGPDCTMDPPLRMALDDLAAVVDKMVAAEAKRVDDIVNPKYTKPFEGDISNAPARTSAWRAGFSW